MPLKTNLSFNAEYFCFSLYAYIADPLYQPSPVPNLPEFVPLTELLLNEDAKSLSMIIHRLSDSFPYSDLAV